MKINFKYICAFLILLATEIFIGLFVRDAIIRPYIGDALVVILMYAFIRGIVQKNIRFLPIYLFFFASAVELTQYYHLADVLHVRNNRIISAVIGTSFDIKDIFCYLAAAVILLIWERVRFRRSK
ncbi:uncharacterized protein DUF2809 [Ruminiclostridium sufflavum DSM 19573]|uniref:Uncharacterized protein DUF2809 n=1 Tax=Ruminiclostridium sufflavum DSM 19573 TaxID=1121337 RepID=A0A318XJY3_9FIRM|nr:DUF2809 domain-containing protein [Ruminiclostridium sufflavum]PYG87319.1 uncharacterized protein DUF2809 [Ruminiclostridium sufflavum DSM 19573]